MDKNKLYQYMDIKNEITETKRRISDIEEEIKKMDSVTEAVIGGRGGKQRYKVTGKAEIRQSKTNLYARRLRLMTFEARLEEMKEEIETYIHTLDDSHIRRILTYRYIDGLTWDDVAKNMGPGHSADAVRVEHQRFLKRS